MHCLDSWHLFCTILLALLLPLIPKKNIFSYYLNLLRVSLILLNEREHALTLAALFNIGCQVLISLYCHFFSLALLHITIKTVQECGIIKFIYFFNNIVKPDGNKKIFLFFIFLFVCLFINILNCSFASVIAVMGVCL